MALLDKRETDWIKENLLFNYCSWDDSELMIESFFKNNDIKIEFDINSYYLCLTGIEQQYLARMNLLETSFNNIPFTDYIIECNKLITEHVRDCGYSGNVFLLKTDNSKRTAVIFSTSSPTADPITLASGLEDIYKNVYNYDSKYISTALVGPFSGYAGIHMAVEEARRLCGLRYFDIVDGVLTPGKIKKAASDPGTGPLLQLLRRFGNELCTGSYSSCIKLLNELFEDILRPSLSQNNTFITYSYIEDVFENFKNAYTLVDFWDRKPLDDFMFLDEYKTYLKDLVSELFGLLAGAKRYSLNILMTISFIRTHLDTDLSLTRLSGFIGINSSSLSTLFNMETGMSISEFINHERIMTAERLLLEPGLTVREISLRAGFASEAYFRNVFRKITGQTLGEYRKAKLLS